MRFLLAILMSLLVAGPSAAEEKRRWIVVAEPDFVTLMYGTPNSGDVPLNLSCHRKGEPLSFSFNHEPRNARNGIKVAVTLSANGIKVTVPTIGERMEMDGQFIVQGHVPLDDRLKKILTSGGVMKVSAGRKSMSIPLEGLAEAARDLLARCG